MTARPIETAMILGAGLGTRMRPLTDARPKPLVEVAGRALIDRVLDDLTVAGVGKAVVNVHYMADVLEAHLARRREPRIAISDERAALLDTGGGVAKALAAGMLGADPFFIHNTDAVWAEGGGAGLRALADAWRPDHMDGLLLLASPRASVGYGGSGDFFIDTSGRLTRAGSGATPYVFAGASIAHPRLFAGAPSGAFSLNLLWDRAMAVGRLYGLSRDGLWLHVGSPQARTEAEAHLIGAAGTQGHEGTN